MEHWAVKDKSRKYVALLLFAAITAIALGSIIKKTGILGQRRRPEITVATASEVEERITAMTGTTEYKQGGTYLHLLQKSDTYAVPQPFESKESVDIRAALSVRIVVDFLQTLTPRQIELMNSDGKLLYADLSSEQQRQLLLLPKYVVTNDNPQRSEIEYSYLEVKVNRDWDYAQFLWHIMRNKTSDVGYSVGLMPG